MRGIMWGVLLSVLVLSVAEAQTIPGASMAERMDRLEKRLMAMEGRALTGGSGAGGVMGSALADLEQRMQELEREGSQINGGVERLSNAVERLAKKVDELAKDFDLRLRDLEAAAHAGGAGGGKLLAGPAVAPAAAADVALPAEPSELPLAAGVSASVATTAVAVPAEMKPEEHYNRAYAYLTAADYANTQTWLEEFLKRHPKHALADNAHYWLGEVHLVQNNPKAALVSFKAGLEAFPKGQKAPANLLKMGMALNQIGQADLARGMWQKLVKDFPKSPEADKAKARMAELPKPANAKN